MNDEHVTANAPPAPGREPVQSHMGELFAALALAQAKAPDVEKGSRNAFHGYSYASSESIIRAARAALAGSGLALVPVEQTIAGNELRRVFLLAHSSGASLQLATSTPIVIDRGKPPDKAVAIACTSGLSYLLRDLFVMARVDAEDEPAAQEDRPASAPARQAAPNGTPGPSPEQLQKIREWKKDLRITDEAWKAILAKRGVARAADLTAEQANELIRTLEHRVSIEQLEEGLREGGGKAALEPKSVAG